MSIRKAQLLRRYILTLATVFSLGNSLLAQKPATPLTPNPQAPTLNVALPLGMQRGTKLELTLTGTNLAEPTGLQTSFPAMITFPSDNNNGKDNAKLRVVLDVPKDAPLGFHTLRLATTRGMSNIRIFCLDELPQVLEVDTNRSRSTPQPVPIPCVVVGRADAELSDYFKIAVTAGQRLSFEVLGRRLGSAFDPQLTLFDVRNGRELPGGHSNDAPGLQTDPRLTYTFRDAGEVLIEIRDVMFRGGPDFGYRLRIGDFPCATTPIPLAAKRGSKVSVNFAGSLVEGVAPVEVTMPTDPTVDAVWVTPRGANGLPGWPVSLAVSDLDELVEQEPNNEPAKANRVPIPGAISGRFQEKGDIDYFVFTLKKGQRVILEAHTHELFSPTEVYLVLKDAKGGQLAATNPATAPRLDYTAPTDGDFYLSAEHLHYWSGPTESYRITFTPYEPGFDLSLALDRFDMIPGNTLSLPIIVNRRDYAGPIEVSVVGSPGFTGQVTIPQGQPPQPNQPGATLIVTAQANLPMGPRQFWIQGKATINSKPVVADVSLRAVLSQNLAALPYPPRQWQRAIAVAIKEKPPFTLAFKFDQADVLRGAAANATVTATRDAGFIEEIVLTPVGVPANVAPVIKNIAKGTNEIKVQLTPAVAAAVGTFPISFTGKAKVQSKEFTVSSAAANLVVVLPFDLKVETVPLKIAVGGKATLKITAARKGGYVGPIGLEIRNLPANVTGSKATIAMGQNEATLEVTVAANAAPGDKADVNVLGTATAAGNQQNASANFTVSVLKK